MSRIKTFVWGTFLIRKCNYFLTFFSSCLYFISEGTVKVDHDIFMRGNIFDFFYNFYFSEVPLKVQNTSRGNCVKKIQNYLFFRVNHFDNIIFNEQCFVYINVYKMFLKLHTALTMNFQFLKFPNILQYSNTICRLSFDKNR